MKRHTAKIMIAAAALAVAVPAGAQSAQTVQTQQAVEAARAKVAAAADAVAQAQMVFTEHYPAIVAARRAAEAFYVDRADGQQGRGFGPARASDDAAREKERAARERDREGS